MLKNSLRLSTQAGKMSLLLARKLLTPAASSTERFFRPRSLNRLTSRHNAQMVVGSTSRRRSSTMETMKCSTIPFQGFRTLSLLMLDLIEHGSQRRLS